jgi:hypothetical protein
MAEHISQARIPTCSEPDCGGLVKPDIVFFGESVSAVLPAISLVDGPFVYTSSAKIQLPPEFATAVPALCSAALVIVMGTSLKVQPFAMLPNLAPRTGCPRLLLNLDPAGTIGVRMVRPSRQVVRALGERGAPSRYDNEGEEGVPADGEEGWEEDGEGEEEEAEEDEEEEEEAWVDDVVHLGACDASVRELCDHLGWREELERVWKEVGGGAVPESKQEGTATATTTSGVDGEGYAKKSLGTVLSRAGHVEGDGFEETMDKVALDLEVALNISPNTTRRRDEGEDERGVANAPLDKPGESELADRAAGDLDA